MLKSITNPKRRTVGPPPVRHYSSMISNPHSRVLIFFAAFAMTAAIQINHASAQNSTKKIRTTPNAIAKKIGSAIQWHPSLDKAMDAAAQSGKPVVWYVSTLPNTFMDRKTEVDRYMLGGPFSWPAIVNTINQTAHATREIPTPELQKKYGLNPYDFVEPGMVIISPQGKVQFSIDRLTTIHPVWLLNLLNEKLGQKNAPELYSQELKPAWAAFANAEYASALATAQTIPDDAGQDTQVESKLLQGMAQFRLGNHDDALKTWAQAAQAHPNLVLGHKCAAESQKIGPFYRGFEIHRKIPPSAMAAGVESIGSAAPKGSYQEDELRHRSVEFLLGMQNTDGGFYDSDYDYGGTDSLPNVYVAVTSLAGMALLAELEQTVPAGAKYDQAKLKQAIQAALQFVLDEQHINKADRDEILWAYAFRLRLIARCQQAKEKLGLENHDFPSDLKRGITSLQSVQSRRGNWYHEYGNPFVTATALLALNEAKSAGGEISSVVVQRGVASLAKDRFGNGAYPYGNRRAGQSKDGNQRDIAASAGRMPLCELALLCNQKSDQTKLTTAITKSLLLHENLDSALKYDNHTSNLAYGGFFFWYDMRSRSEAIQAITNKNVRLEFQKQHKALIMALPELDGCFIDSHELGRVYGTSMALLSLANVNKQTDPAPSK